MQTPTQTHTTGYLLTILLPSSEGMYVPDHEPIAVYPERETAEREGERLVQLICQRDEELERYYKTYHRGAFHYKTKDEVKAIESDILARYPDVPSNTHGDKPDYCVTEIKVYGV